MKVTLPILFLVIFFGCKNETDKNINYTLHTSAELYPVDSALFTIPCTREALMTIAYRGSVRYIVKDIDVAEKKTKEMIATSFSDLETRNEYTTNKLISKSYQYTIPTTYFLLIENKLDSLFGRADNKEINKMAVNYDHILENLIEEQKTYKMFVNRYNNVGMSVQEKNELLTIIKDSGNNIKRTQSSIQAYCENKSTFTITFQMATKL